MHGSWMQNLCGSMAAQYGLIFLKSFDMIEKMIIKFPLSCQFIKGTLKTSAALQ